MFIMFLIRSLPPMAIFIHMMMIGVLQHQLQQSKGLDITHKLDVMLWQDLRYSFNCRYALGFHFAVLCKTIGYR